MCMSYEGETPTALIERSLATMSRVQEKLWILAEWVESWTKGIVFLRAPFNCHLQQILQGCVCLPGDIALQALDVNSSACFLHFNVISSYVTRAVERTNQRACRPSVETLKKKGFAQELFYHAPEDSGGSVGSDEGIASVCSK